MTFVVIIEANLGDNKTSKLVGTGTLRHCYANKVLVHEFVRSPLIENMFTWVTPLQLDIWIKEKVNINL